ncbi:hypothetical protein [Hyphococcus sp.]|jgi:sporulation protein YlmC with PRC-barrel domain|uniref:hypothetical protein n=1 Tax=Hyphococcus sp. TaxID=2038636 RepID=UPI003D13104C
MNKLLITACAAALMLPASASAMDMHKDKTKTESSAAVSSEAGIYLAKTSLSAKELLGEGIYGVKGDRIARIDDIVLDANGKADKVVFLSGGVFGFGGTRGALDYKAMTIAYENDYEPVVSVSLSEEGVKSAVEYETTQMNDYSLVSEIIGSKVDLVDGADEDDDAVINDIILSEAGTVEHLIVQESALGSIGAGTKYAVPYSKLTVAQGDGGLVLDMTEEQLEASPVFKASWREQAGADIKKTWEKTKDGASDLKDDVENEIDD